MSFYQVLLSRKNIVEQQINELDSSDWITKMSLQAHLDNILSEIAKIEANKELEPSKLIITFSGNPVNNSHGIVADFVAKAIQPLTDAISILATNENVTIRSMEEIHHKYSNKLYITGVALGSFGFVLEEMLSTEKQLPLNNNTESDIKKAFYQIINFLNSTISSDEIVSEYLNEINDRALKKIRLFLTILNKNNALCNIKINDKKVSFKEHNDVKESLKRLRPDNIKRTNENLTGYFIGYLPISRKCEFKNIKTGDILNIKVPDNFINSDEINQNLNTKITIETICSIAGKSKPKYTLCSIPAWSDQIKFF